MEAQYKTRLADMEAMSDGRSKQTRDYEARLREADEELLGLRTRVRPPLCLPVGPLSPLRR